MASRNIVMKAAADSNIVRRTLTKDPLAALANEHAKHTAALTAPGNSPENDEAMQELVTAFVPKTFKLRKADHSEIWVTEGLQDMPQWMAEHWWSVANGVEVKKGKA